MKNLLVKVLLAGVLFLVINWSCLAQTMPGSVTVEGMESRLDYGYGTNDAPLATVGSQIWFGKNLNVDHFANGDAIPEAKSEDEWKRANEDKLAAWYYYNNDPANGPIYGRLYNWFAVNDPRGLAPGGWHVPSDTEWDTMIQDVGGNNAELNKPVRSGNSTYYITKEVGTLLKSTSGWKKNGGTNTSGIAGLPGGNRLSHGKFNYIGEYGSWWSSSMRDADNAWYRGLYFGNGKVNRFAFFKSCGFSVRCIKD